MKKFFKENAIVFVLLLAVLGLGGVEAVNNATVFTGAVVSKNYVKNANCDYSAHDLTASAGTPAPTSVASGGTACRWNPGSNSATIDILIGDVSTDDLGKQCVAHVDAEAYGADGVYTMSLLYDGSQVGATVNATKSDGVFVFGDITYPCGTTSSTARKIRITAPASGSVPALVFRSASFAPLPTMNLGFAMPTGLPQVVTPTPALTSTTGTTPVKGTTTGGGVDRWVWNQVGNKMFFSMEYAQSATTGSTKGGGDTLFAIPSSIGCTVDSTKVTFYTGSAATSVPNVIASGQVTSSTSSQPASAVMYDSSHFRIVAGANGTASTNFVGGANSWYDTTQASVSYTVSGSVPCAGWSASQATWSMTCPFDGSCVNEFSLKVSTSCTSTPCTITTQNVPNWATSVSRASTGNYTVNFASSLFSVAPSCTVTSSAQGNQKVSTSTSAYNFTTESTGSFVDSSFDVQCSRQGSDIKPQINAPLIIGSVATQIPNAKEKRWKFNYYNTAVGTVCSSSPCSTDPTLPSGASLTYSGGVYSFNVPSNTCSTTLACTVLGSNAVNAIMPLADGSAPTKTAYKFAFVTYGSGSNAATFGTADCSCY